MSLTEKALSLTEMWSKLGELRDKLVHHINSPSEVEALMEEIKELMRKIGKTERELGITKSKQLGFASESLMSLYQKECEVMEHQVDQTGLE